MKCLVTGGNVKGELGLAGRWGGGTWDSQSASLTRCSFPLSAGQGRPLSIPYWGRALPGATGRRGKGLRYVGGRVAFQ